MRKLLPMQWISLIRVEYTDRIVEGTVRLGTRLVSTEKHGRCPEMRGGGAVRQHSQDERLPDTWVAVLCARRAAACDVAHKFPRATLVRASV